ncbi:MAG: HD domain-containing protein [Phycisphaerales bacterium]|nr:HD domain-containing protein [Phycisphaerales bacterium]
MTTAQKRSAAYSHRFIDQLQPGETLEDAVFMISQKDLRTTTSGSLYIHMVFADRSGQLLARVWQATQAQFDQIADGGFLRIRGRVESYKGTLQVIVDAMQAVAPNQIDVGDYLPRTRHDIEDMWQRVLSVLRTIKSPELLKLIKAFVQDETIVTGFKKAPAAIQNHHAYIGGLLEHTCSLLELATRIFGKQDDSDSHYPEVSRDLVLAGIFLHDIGKTAELTYDTNFAYSTEGQLVGHITQAAIWIDRKIREVERESEEPFPPDLRNLLIHIVLSHHGQYEFGSPKLPACLEAFVVHYLDNIDAKLNIGFAAIDGAKDGESDWTSYIRSLETRFFKKDVMGCRSAPSE